jgi:hypothetical protein
MEMTPKVYPHPVGFHENLESPKYDWPDINNFFGDNVYDFDWVGDEGMTYTHGNKGFRASLKEFDKNVFLKNNATGKTSFG